MRSIVLVSGRIFTGKSGLATKLQDEFGYAVLQTSAVLKELAEREGKPVNRIALQQFGDDQDKVTNYQWVCKAVHDFAKTLKENQPIVVDNIRNAGQLACFRNEKNWKIIHIHLYAPTDVLEARFQTHRFHNPNETAKDFDQADPLKRDSDVEHFKMDADVRINTGRTDADDVLVRVAARLGLYSRPVVRCVDVIVGGQYGSEGKGHIAAYLAHQYDVLVRVGGPNAGHTVASPVSGVYTYHHLPSGCKDTNAKILLGPGITLRVKELLEEIKACDITPERLFIDPQALIIEEADIEAEKEIKKTIASTGRGGGAAAARRIVNRVPGAVRLAKDIPELAAYVGTEPNYRGSITKQLERAYQAGHSILLEGTQGSGLSLFHGDYPWVTSRDTNVAGCLAEAGISPSRVRRILMVVRPTPIRVGNPDVEGNEDSANGKTSGRLKHEVSLRDIARSARLGIKELSKYEKTSTTKRKRRIGWFEWDQFLKACNLNAPTDIVLTFADYIHVKNREARRFEQLTQDTIKFIEELERIAQAPVSLINTRFPREGNDFRSVIDRRNWTAQIKDV